LLAVTARRLVGGSGIVRDDVSVKALHLRWGRVQLANRPGADQWVCGAAFRR
jgi:hypothetical protein